MKAMLLHQIVSLDENPEPLTMAELPQPRPNEHEVSIRVTACGVCHTELDEIEGRTPPPRLPIVLGHEIDFVTSSGPSQAFAFDVDNVRLIPEPAGAGQALGAALGVLAATALRRAAGPRRRPVRRRSSGA